MIHGVSLRAGEYLTKTWEVDDGLPESGVTDIAQSSEGYLWVATLNSGLSRFDGMRFVNFDSANVPQLADRGVRRLIVDANGTMWINGFGNYLASWRAGHFQLEYAGPAVIMSLVTSDSNRVVFTTQEGQLLQGSVAADGSRTWKKIAPPSAGVNPRFIADAEGGLWYRNTNRQVLRFRGEKFDLMSSFAGTNAVTALAGDGQGRIALGTRRQFLIWTGDHFEDASPTNEETVLAVQGIVSDGTGGWWIESNKRLRRCKNRLWIAEAKDWNSQQRIWSRVFHEQPDDSGGLWFTYLDGGLVHVSETGRLSELTTREGLPSNTIRTLLQDRDHDVWLCFEGGGGLVRVRARKFDVIGKSDGLADIVTTSVCEDREGAIWIGTLGGGVSCFRGQRCTNYVLPLYGSGHCEKSLVFPDEEGRVWIGTHGNGLLVWENGQFHQVLSFKETGVRIRALLADHKHRVWIASQDGLYRFGSGALRRLRASSSVEDYPTAIAEDGNNIWVGMNNGTLLNYVDNKLTAFEPANISLRRRFYALLPDTNGTVWIGTMGSGLLRFRDGQFSAITTAKGLPTDTISQVLTDSSCNLWLGWRAGVFSVERSLLNDCADGMAETVSCREYGRDDGLPALGCTAGFQPTSWSGRDGRLWFATGRGATCAQPLVSQIVQPPPSVLLEEVRVDGKLRTTEANAPISPAALDIPPGPHHLEFRYTGLSFSAPDRIRFKYILEGLDPGWIEAAGIRTASYNSVPPGKYRFQVMACNGDGIWSESSASLALIIRPHVWETLWFRIMIGAALLLAVAGSVWSYERRRNRQRLEQLERQQVLERERVRVARDLHDDLGAGLTEIGLLGALAQRANAPPDRVRQHLGNITEKAREMVVSLDEIVWSLNPRNDSLVSLCNYFCEYAQQFLQLTPIRCRLDVAENLPACTLISDQRHHLLLAFKEALTNVVRHSQATEVRVGISTLNGALIISVADNGNGLATMAKPEAGEGLANLSRRLEQLNGRCEVSSTQKRGTIVRLILPLPKISTDEKLPL